MFSRQILFAHYVSFWFFKIIFQKIRDAIKYLTSAVQLYMNCLELFDEQNKKSLREKIRANLEHAECLKDRLRPVSDKFLPSTRIFSDCDVWADFPQVNLIYFDWSINPYILEYHRNFFAC